MQDHKLDICQRGLLDAPQVIVVRRIENLKQPETAKNVIDVDKSDEFVFNQTVNGIGAFQPKSSQIGTEQNSEMNSD